MENIEPKKLALLRILQIFRGYSDYSHPLTQDDIAYYLDTEYGIILERKAISRNISLLKEAGFEIEQRKGGSYLASREFDDSELRMLIDGILSSRHITVSHSKSLIERICGLSNKYFRSSVKHIYSVGEWSKTDNQSLFLNIELADAAIEKKRMVHYDYNKYGADKKLHKSSEQYVSPYQMILHNQRYYLMAYSEYWGNMVFHRLDRITNMTITDRQAFPVRKIKGYENGISYRELSSTMPYMYTDRPERIIFTADVSVIDQIIDWFGRDITVVKTNDPEKAEISLTASPNAMFHWAMQYIGHIEVTSPDSLRKRIRDGLKDGLKKYQ